MSHFNISGRSFPATAVIIGLLMLARGFGQSVDRPAGNGGIHPFRIQGGQLLVPAGTYLVAGKPVQVATEAKLLIRPADRVQVESEETLLSEKKPGGFFSGTMLRGPKSGSIGAFGSLIPSSLVIKDAAGGRLVEGEDYLVSAPFALIGIGPRARVTPATKVYASYAYYTQRIDSVVVTAGGAVSLVEGQGRVYSPRIPAAPAGSVTIANVYRPFRAEELAEAHVFPIESNPAQSATASRGGLIPRTMAKIAAGKPVKVVCWGDSITVGGDVLPAEAWANRLQVELSARFPRAQFTFANHSIGGTKSAQWLANGDYPGLPKQNAEKCRFDLVLGEKPDLVVMEFLNDVVFPEDVLTRTYAAIHEEFNRRGIEWIIVTPSLKIPEKFDLAEMKDETPRVLDLFLVRFASSHSYPVADASARWRHLHREGTPFFALFNNAYNHPNAFGHGLFVEEILKCFNP